VGCGAGRHCRKLAGKGFNVLGIDLALSSIHRAKKYTTESMKFLRHDMRLPFGVNCYDYVFNFFTSFGYFNDYDENLKVISNMANSLRRGGTLVLDYLNVKPAEERLVTWEKQEIDGIVYQIRRWTDKTHFYKKIIILDVERDEMFEHTEQVAKLELEDFEAMFEPHNLEIEEVFGDYKLNEYDKQKSARMIMIAKKF
jgi:SAM-dependent methyltransferase